MNKEDVIVVGNSSFYRPSVKGKDFAKLEKQFPNKRKDILHALADKLAGEAKAEKEEREAKAAEKAKAKEDAKPSNSGQEADK